MPTYFCTRFQLLDDYDDSTQSDIPTDKVSVYFVIITHSRVQER